MSITSSRSRQSSASRCVNALFALLLVLSFVPTSIQAYSAEASSTNIKWPFVSGATWYVSQGYNTSPSEGWSHFNCNPTTLKDAISNTQSCSQYYQYKYSFDVKRLDGNTAGQTVVSPVNGTIRWIDEAYGGMSIDLGDGYAYAYFHTILASGLAAGQSVTQGQYLGTVAPAGQAGNGGTAHIHLTLWQTIDGGNWSRNAVPFTGVRSIDGADFPALADTSRNQHYQKQISSSNMVVGAGTGTPPAIPTLASPSTGTTYLTTGVTPTLTWNAVSGATEYQVVVNDGGITSPWLSTTSWKMSSLANGQYAWQVRARNSGGTSNLSAKWVFWVDPPGGTSTPTPTPGPTGTPGSLALNLNRATTTINADVIATGSGFGPNETVRIYLDSKTSTAFTSVTAAGNGSFSKTFPMPETFGGSHTIYAVGATSTKQATKTITVNPSLTRTPYQGPPGTSISVTVYGFGASETVRLYFDSTSGATLGNASTNARGTGTVSITMPQASNGWHDYVGKGQTSNLVAWGALYVERTVTLSPTGGASGTSVTVTARGFPASESISVGWNKTATVAGTTKCTGTSSSTGNYSCSFVVPTSTAGSYPIGVLSSSGAFTSANFIVSGPAGVSISPTSGAVMSNVSLSGGGFSPNEQIKLSWDDASSAWATIQADANGAFSWSGTIPSISTGGRTLKALGLTSAKLATTTFTVNTSGGNNGSSMISPGTYRVTATIEGLVGHTTSNGHLITPFDHFVALPACTESSCDWLTSGSSSTYVADCNDNCYVRVTNPATGLCSVAPVWDVGPWFTNDNWWEPANKRTLNTRQGAVNQLAQGYTAADAARNGLDVGYGLSSGIGISNVGYQTGNRAAIDIADGTWVDIGFAQAAGIGTVEVTMLWQTGEHHSVAEVGCGQTPQKLAITLDPVTGPVGTSVKVSGTLFGANETVKIYLDSSSTTAIGTVSTNAAGAFSKNVTVPATSIGTHKIHAVGQSSGKRKSLTFTVTAPPPPAVTLNPKTGPAGTSIQVTGTNYDPGESVKVYLNSTRTTPLATINANSSGVWVATITMPDTVGGNQRIHGVGQKSSKRAANTFKVTPTVTSSASTGTARKTLTISVKGFTAGEVVEFFWDGSSTREGTSTTNSNGVAQFTVKAPWTNGPHTGTAKGKSSKMEGSTTFSVVPNVRLTPRSGDDLTSFEVRGTGFAPSTTVNVFWDRSGNGNLLCSARTSSTYGTFTCVVTPISGTSLGSHTVLAIGPGLTASATFSVTSIAVRQSSIETSTPTATTTPTPAATASPVETESATETAEATVEPTQTAEPTETPMPEPTATAEPVQREVVVLAIADTSVSAAAAELPQPLEGSETLPAGGESGEAALISFSVEGIAAGTVISASLVLTSYGDIGAAPGFVYAIAGYYVEEQALTYSGIALDGLQPALRVDGLVTAIDWIEPGQEIWIDVTGSVTAEGLITFVIPSNAENPVRFSSREGGAPPKLVITILESP